MFRIRAEPGRIAPECMVCICTLNRAGKARLTRGLIATKTIRRIPLLSDRNGTDFEIFGFRAAFGLCRGTTKPRRTGSLSAYQRQASGPAWKKAVVGLFKGRLCLKFYGSSYFPTIPRMSAMIFSASASVEALSRLSL